MFTGIIQAMEPVVLVAPKGKCIRVRIKRPAKWRLTLGQSISIDGICSTITVLGKTFFEVEYMPETLVKTTAESFRKNTAVNLERSLTLRDFVDGHLVQGHVDTRGMVQKVTGEETKEITIAMPKGFTQYIATKGSITVNGVSLTVAKAEKNTFRVALIPYTLKHTNLGLLKKGDSINIEIDMVARYLERMGERR